MNLLAPLFLVGALAVALPIVFHLIRRTTRTRVTFSSLMFLRPTAPRVTRRRRFEHILLLLLRCAVLCLVALAFSRPFLQRDLPELPRQPGISRRLVLVDASASMRRDALWPDAVSKAEELLRQARPGDAMGVYLFDRGVRGLMTLDEWGTLAAGERASITASRLRAAKPGWSATDLDLALIHAAQALDEARQDKSETAGPAEIVVLTDLQEGSRVNRLQGFEWPRDVRVRIEALRPKRPTHAGLQLAAGDDERAAPASNAVVRVRVLNDPGSQREQFRVAWTAVGLDSASAAPVEVYVAPGQNRVVKLPVPKLEAGATARVTLSGDDGDFDNTLHWLAPEASDVSVLHFGTETGEDPTESFYFVRRALQDTPRQRIQFVQAQNTRPLPAVSTTVLVLVSGPMDGSGLAWVRDALSQGRTVLCLLKDAASGVVLGQLLNQPALEVPEADVRRYAMLAEIDFRHPLFAPLADGRFNDFTKIHFWKYRRLATNQIADARVIARYDSGDAAWIEIPTGRGRVLVATSGWHPRDSQLGLASKFVPLLYGWMEMNGAAVRSAAAYAVGDPVPLESLGLATNRVYELRPPEGASVMLNADQPVITAADQPGAYALTAAPPAAPRHFVVNLAPEESRTGLLPIEELSRMGVPLESGTVDAEKAATKQRQRLNAEVEDRQKLWRLLLLAALALVLVETVLAGWLTRRRAAGAPASA
jgi:hypothetical protein